MAQTDVCLLHELSVIIVISVCCGTLPVQDPRLIPLLYDLCFFRGGFQGAAFIALCGSRKIPRIVCGIQCL